MVNEGVDKLTRLRRFGFNLVEAVIGTGPHVESRIHTGRIEGLGKSHGFIAEKSMPPTPIHVGGKPERSLRVAGEA